MFACAALAISTRAAAQPCTPGWVPGTPIPGVDGPVYAAVAWDPDGPGPQPARLVIGGDFAVAGAVAASGLAMWDGAAWQAIGGGVTTLSHTTYGIINGAVYTLAVHNGELYVGGSFAQAGGVVSANLAKRRTDGTWQAFGTTVNGAVYTSAVYQDSLVIAGSFTAPGMRLARWDGAAWSTLSAGVNDAVTALAVHADQLVASGYFTTAGGAGVASIARWNGSQWSGLGAGLSGGYAYALASYNGELFAAGGFDTAGGVPASNIARWSDPAAGGSGWRPVGAGVNGSVYEMAIYGSELLVAGGLSEAGGQAVDHIARWDGAQWLSMGSGPGAVIGSPTSWIGAIAAVDGALFTGGDFSSAGGAPAGSIAAWSGAPGSGGWQPLGTGAMIQRDAAVAALAIYGDDLIAGGTFSSIEGVAAGRIARWSGPGGPGWRPVGTGAGITGPGAAVFAMAPYSSALIAAGQFSAADGVAASNIAQWNGSAWQPLGSGTNGVVRALTVFGGDLIAGGDFTTAGGVSCARVARWNGTAWTPMGAGFTNTVYALLEFNGTLHASGRLPFGIMKWDGSAWQTLSQNLVGFWEPPDRYYPPVVFSMAKTVQGKLIAGGFFPGTMSVGSRNVMAWDGVAWSPVGGGYGSYFNTNGTGDTVYTVAVSGDRIYVGGSLGSYSGGFAFHLGVFDGSQWQPPGGGANQPVNALLVHEGALIVGGRFTGAGGATAPHWALWPDLAPWIAVDPVSLPAACPGQTVTFSVAPGAGLSALTFAWRRNGVPLVDGPTGTGSVISGAASAELSIGPISGPDVGAYDCVVSDQCGSAISRSAQLRTCAADLDCNGAVEPADIALAVGIWLQSVANGTLNGDFDANGAVQPADIAAFVNAWFTAVRFGC